MHVVRREAHLSDLLHRLPENRGASCIRVAGQRLTELRQSHAGQV